MIPVAMYVLRERTRPSNEEATSIFLSCVRQCQGVDLTSGGQVVHYIANVQRPSEDLDRDFEAFIRESGGEKYQNKPREYKWRYFEAQMDDPPERTCIALVFSLQGVNAGQLMPRPSVQEFLLRGSRWEALGLWGNALLCYLIGQSLYQDDLDLKLRAGEGYLRQPDLAPAAYRQLLEVAESRPCAQEPASALAECYLLMADNPRSEIRGSTRDELRAWALMHLERAAALAPDNSVVCKKRNQLRDQLGANPSLDFFSVE
ncbi:MAG: hypothetical protein JMN25_00775 [gamma proteobacterium endosymbiont of Lamellibrachia anaximandri]|nr:hypothetical protein [gamma proteobacterium endosymbiont of Lamellibrachia anaximandri]